MLNRRFYILVIILSVLFFSTQKSRASNRLPSKYKIHCNFAKKPIQAARNNYQDALINPDDNDDDETSSRARHKLSKASALQNLKFNTHQHKACFLYTSRFSSGSQRAFRPSGFVFFKTRRSITICCLRI